MRFLKPVMQYAQGREAHPLLPLHAASAGAAVEDVALQDMSAARRSSAENLDPLGQAAEQQFFAALAALKQGGQQMLRLFECRGAHGEVPAAAVAAIEKGLLAHAKKNEELSELSALAGPLLFAKKNGNRERVRLFNEMREIQAQVAYLGRLVGTAKSAVAVAVADDADSAAVAETGDVSALADGAAVAADPGTKTAATARALAGSTTTARAAASSGSAGATAVTSAGPTLTKQAQNDAWDRMGACMDAIHRGVARTSFQLTNAEIDSIRLRRALPAEAQVLSSMKLLPSRLELPLSAETLPDLKGHLKHFHALLVELYLAKGDRLRQLRNLPFTDALIKDSTRALQQFMRHNKDSKAPALDGLDAVLVEVEKITALARRFHYVDMVGTALQIEEIGVSLLAEAPAATCHQMMKEEGYGYSQVIQHIGEGKKLRFALSSLVAMPRQMLSLFARTMSAADAFRFVQVANLLLGLEQDILPLAQIVDRAENLKLAQVALTAAKDAHAIASRDKNTADHNFSQARLRYAATPTEREVVLDKAAAEIANNKAVAECKTAAAALVAAECQAQLREREEPQQKLAAARQALDRIFSLWEGKDKRSPDPFLNVSLDREHVEQVILSMVKELPCPQLDRFVTHLTLEARSQGFVLDGEFTTSLEQVVSRHSDIARAEKILADSIRHETSGSATDREQLAHLYEMPVSALDGGADGDAELMPVPLAREHLRAIRRLEDGEDAKVYKVMDALVGGGRETIQACLHEMIAANPVAAWLDLVTEPGLNRIATLMQAAFDQGFAGLDASKQGEILAHARAVIGLQGIDELHKQSMIEILIANIGKFHERSAENTVCDLLQTFLRDAPLRKDAVFPTLLRHLSDIRSIRMKTAMLRLFRHQPEHAANIEKSIAALRAMRFCETHGLQFSRDAHGAAFDVFASSMAMATLPEKVRAHQVLVEEYGMLNRSRRASADAMPLEKILKTGLSAGTAGLAIGGVAGFMAGFIHSLVSAKMKLGQDVGILAGVGAALPVTALAARSAAQSLMRTESVHDAAFRLMQADLDIHGIQAQRSAAEQLQALTDIAPLWQSLLKNLPGFDLRQQHALLSLYFDQTDRNNPHAMDAEHLRLVRDALAPDPEARTVLLNHLPGLLAQMKDKPLLHMSATRLLGELAGSGTWSQQEVACAAIQEALEFTPGLLSAISNPLVLRGQASRRALEQASLIRQETQAMMMYMDELRFLEEGRPSLSAETDALSDDGYSEEEETGEHSPLIPVAGAGSSGNFRFPAISAIASGAGMDTAAAPGRGSSAGSRPAPVRPAGRETAAANEVAQTANSGSKTGPATGQTPVPTMASTTGPASGPARAAFVLPDISLPDLSAREDLFVVGGSSDEEDYESD